PGQAFRRVARIFQRREKIFLALACEFFLRCPEVCNALCDFFTLSSDSLLLFGHAHPFLSRVHAHWWSRLGRELGHGVAGLWLLIAFSHCRCIPHGRAIFGAARLSDIPMIAPDLRSGVERLGDMIAQASTIVPFTGAGISTECGIPDFRSPGGLWTRNRPIPFDEFVASPHARDEAWRRRFAMEPTCAATRNWLSIATCSWRSDHRWWSGRPRDFRCWPRTAAPDW